MTAATADMRSHTLTYARIPHTALHPSRTVAAATAATAAAAVAAVVL